MENVKTKVILKKRYTGCYLVLNAMAIDFNDILPAWDLQIVYSEDTEGKWVVEGGDRHEYDTKRDAAKAIEDELLQDVKVIWLGSDEVKNRLSKFKKNNK